MAQDQGTGQGKTAIVTGGSRGIGRGVAEALLGDGWRVFFCSRDPESVRRALREMRERFGDERVAGKAVDVRDAAAVEVFVGEVVDRAGRVDCLVNNAGLGYFAPVDELSVEQFREVVETNLHGCFYFLKAVAPAMKRQGSGWILNIASLAGKNPFAGGAAYNASKFGLVGLSEAAMLDLRSHGVRVAAILPGSVATGFAGREGGEKEKKEKKDESWKLQPEDIASMVLHLLRQPGNVLPSLIEMRPSQPPGK